MRWIVVFEQYAESVTTVTAPPAGSWCGSTISISSPTPAEEVKLDEDAKPNVTDPESSLMKARIPEANGPNERMERKLRKRGSRVEPVFGQHVNRGYDQFLLWGRRRARAEQSLFSATHNLLKLWRGDWEPDRRPVADEITPVTRDGTYFLAIK